MRYRAELLLALAVLGGLLAPVLLSTGQDRARAVLGYLLVLVVAAGLFVRTFASLADVRLGFDPNPLLIVDVNAKRSAAGADA